MMFEIDKEFVAKLKADKNPDDFEVMFKYYAPRIKSLLIKSGADHAQAEDIMHDTMLNVWQKIDLYNSDKGSFSSWVFTIARNNRIDLLRKKSSQPYTDITEIEIISDTKDGQTIIEEDSVRKNLSNAIDSLPEKQKEIIQLSYINDMTQEEISKYLSIPVGTVKSRMRLAYQKMKDNLGGLII